MCEARSKRFKKSWARFRIRKSKFKILQALVGGVTVADVRLAQASGAVIIGFNVVPDEAARSLADELQVEVRRYDIIYKVTDDLKAMLEGKLKPEEQVVEMGMAMDFADVQYQQSRNDCGLPRHARNHPA